MTILIKKLKNTNRKISREIMGKEGSGVHFFWLEFTIILKCLCIVVIPSNYLLLLSGIILTRISKV